MEQLIEVLLEGEKLASAHVSLNLETFGINDLVERLSKNFGKQEGRRLIPRYPAPKLH